MPALNRLRINGVDYDISGGGGGTSDYSQLTNKPQINGNTLSGNKTSSELGLASASDIPDVSTKYDTGDSPETELADGDYVPFYDTSATTKKKTLWSSIKAKLKAYFDSLYVGKVSGKGLSTNDYTTADKNKVDALGTASTKNVPASGNASSTEVVMGNDTRLSNSRPASDVYDWAKTATKPTYTKSEVGLGNVPNVTTNNQTPTFTQATTRANIASGEKLSVILGKIMKWYADLKTVAFTGSYNDLTNKPTIPDISTKVSKSGDTMTGNLNVANASIIVTEHLPSEDFTLTITGSDIKINGTSIIKTGNVRDVTFYNNYSSGITLGTLEVDDGSAVPDGYEIVMPQLKTVNGQSLIGSGDIPVSGLVPTVLWTNSDPSSTFATTTVYFNRNIKQFSYISIVYKDMNTNDVVTSTGLIPMPSGSSGNNVIRLSAPGGYNYRRDITLNVAGTINHSATIDDCVRYSSYGSATTAVNNGHLIPYKIIAFN